MAADTTAPQRPTAPHLTGALFDDSFYAGDPFPHYARLRAEAPLVWHENPGVWIVSRHADVIAVSRDPGTFSSARGILTMEIGVEYPSPPTMMHTDPPVHTRLRNVLSSGFRPSRIRRLEPQIRARIEALVAQIPDGEQVDIVDALAGPLPLMVICDLLGLPPEQWRTFMEWSDAVIPGAAELSAERRAEMIDSLDSLLRDTIAQRMSAPGTDFVSDLVTADADGSPLDEDEIHMLVNQLLIAGNETTRNLLSGGLVALAQHPDQWQLLRDDASVIPSAVEELLRWTTPVVGFMRTATTETELSGQRIYAGDPLLLLYASADRDEAEFGNSGEVLDVTRSPNAQLSFGFGPHFCIGAALTRLEARVALEAMVQRFARLAVTGALERTPSGIIAGVRRAEMTFR